MTKVHEGQAGDSIEVESGGVIEVKSGGRIHLESGADLRVASGASVTEDSGGKVLGRAALTTYMPDLGTAGSSFVVSPFDGTVVGLAVVNHAANAGTKSVITSKIAGGAITHPAFEVAQTATAGSVSSVTPTAANKVAAGQAIELITDGGSSAVTPATFTVTILRSS